MLLVEVIAKLTRKMGILQLLIIIAELTTHIIDTRKLMVKTQATRFQVEKLK